MGRFSSRFMNCALVVLAVLGILFIISGHGESFLNREGFVNVGDISPGDFPGDNGLLGNDYPLLKTKKCGLSKNGVCSRCAFEQKVKMGTFNQVTNNDLYKTSSTVNDGTTYPSEITFYGPRRSPAQRQPYQIGRGMRVNKWQSVKNWKPLFC